MTDRPPTRTTDSDWLGARGDKWRAQLPRLEAMLAPVDEPLIAALDLVAPVRVADVGCGGGATARAIFRHAPAGSSVHGFDLVPTVIEIARRRSEPDARTLSFDAADMSTAGPPGDPYDRLASRFGVMFFDDPPKAFANLLRWLVPGGLFAFAVWARPQDNLWMATVREVVGAVVALPAIDPLAPGPFRYADVSTMVALLGGAGFRDVDARPWRGKLPVGGGLPAAEAADFALAGLSSFSELLAGAGGGARDRALHALTARFAPHEENGAVQMGASVHIVTGARPR